jgi:DNA replication protein DnaC
LKLNWHGILCGYRIIASVIFECKIRITIITSQLPVKNWYDCFAESTIADAILDRLTNGSYRIELSGKSMRKILRNEQ